MKWAEIRIDCEAGTDEIIAGAVNQYSPYLSVDGGGESVRLWLPVDDRVEPALVGICNSLDSLPQDLIGSRPEVTITYVEDSDWSLAWKDFFRAFTIADTFRVAPPWEAESEPGLLDVIIDPGMAFGTGQHPTTAMLMRMMAAEPPIGKLVADVGSGSAILAISAARLGASRVVAVECDPVAAENGVRNVKLNGLESVIDYRIGDSLPADEPQFGLILVNILANVIISLAPSVSDALRPGGSVYCSGVIDNRLDDVCHKLRQVGLVSLEVHNDGEWRAISGRRPQNQ